MSKTQPLITIFTPSHADAAGTNAQQLTVKELVARLPSDRFRVVMFCGGQPDPRIVARPNTLLIPARPHGNTRRFLTRLLRERPDIYFFPRTGPLDRIVFDLRKHMGLKTALVTYIVMAMNDLTANPMIRRSIREGSTVFGNSVHVSKTIQEIFGVEAQTMYDGIDQRYYYPPKGFENAPPENAAPVVLYAGSFQPRKRVELIIEQAARHPHVQFRLAGRGDTEENCYALAKKLGCSNVQFMGHLSSQELGDEMRRANLFLFPSILEGHPQVLGQAAACGLPCIALNLYRPDYVINGESAFLVESDAELADKLGLLLGDATLRRSMSLAAATHAREFDWDYIALQWQEVFENVTAKR